MRLGLALVPPLVALLLQFALWSFIRPSVWFLFYPAVFLSSWIGGLRAAVVAAGACVVAVLWFFLPPERSFLKPVYEYVAAGVFVSTSVLFGVFHDRLRRATRRSASVLAASERANETLQEVIDQRERARQQLEQANEALNDLVEQAPEGIFVADLEGRYTHVNTAACRMLGYTREELVGKTIGDLIPPERIEQLEREKKEMLEGHTEVSEWTLRRKDGTYLPVEVSAKILRDGRWQAFVRDVTRRRELEAALREKNADLHRAQSVARVGSWRLDVRRNELRWTDESYRIFGVPPGTPMTYERFLACVHPDDRDFVDRAWKAALGGEPYDIEHRIIVGGKVKWVREKADLEFDEDHALVGGMGITQDISDRKQLEEELRLAEAKSSGIISISADAIISIDDAQRITLFNSGAERIFGYTKDEVMGRPLDVLIPERFRSIHRRHVGSFASGRDVARRMGERRLETVGVRRSGEEFPVDAAISSMKVGGTTILTVALRDVSEERRIEREQVFLAEFGAILSSSLDLEATMVSIGELATRALADVCVVYLLDDGGDVCQLNAVVRDPSLRWAGQVLSRKPLERSRVPQIWSELEAGRPVLLEDITPEFLTSLARDDEQLSHALRAIRPRSVIAAPLFTHAKLVGAMAFVSSTPGRTYTSTDVGFGERVAQRAALALDNARLYADARHAIQSRDDVLGVVAHDLRNPLANIRMEAALLGHPGTTPARRRKAATTIERAATRMGRLIQDLLDVTKLEAGGLPLERSRVSARQVVVDAVDAQRPLASSAALELHVDVAPELPELSADRHRLLQVFDNLIGNAAKFTPPGGRIIVGARPGQGEVLLWVADTGAGIAPEDLPHVFDRFWQARGPGSRGAGLGLTIVKGIVEAHGGRIWVESTAGRGTTVSFTIPAAAPRERAPVEEQPHGA